MTDKFKNINMVKWEIKVFVDYREKYIKEYFEKNKEYDNSYVYNIKNKLN